MGKKLGIDLGTTNSIMAVVDDEKVRIIHNLEGDQQTPSVVSYWKGDILIGKTALQHIQHAPKDTITSIKRLIGRTASDPEIQKVRDTVSYEIVEDTNGTGEVRVRLGGGERSPEGIVSLILHKLKEDAEHVLGEDATSAVIAVPWYFNDKQRQATCKAGEMAGFQVVDILDEPAAAVMALAARTDVEGKRVLVYDLGGGTFDASVLRVDEGKFITLNSDGNKWLGGDVLDRQIVDYAVDRIMKAYQVDPTSNAKFMEKIREESRNAKEILSAGSRADIIIPGILTSGSGEIVTVELEITKEEFESIAEPIINETISIVERSIVNSKSSLGDIDMILIVGNASAVPMAERKLRKLFGEGKRFVIGSSKNCIARGAAISALPFKTSPSLETTEAEPTSDAMPVTVISEPVKEEADFYAIPRDPEYDCPICKNSQGVIRNDINLTQIITSENSTILLWKISLKCTTCKNDFGSCLERKLPGKHKIEIIDLSSKERATRNDPSSPIPVSGTEHPIPTTDERKGPGPEDPVSARSVDRACPKCLYDNRIGATFCGRCGLKLSDGGASAPPIATPPGSPPGPDAHKNRVQETVPNPVKVVPKKPMVSKCPRCNYEVKNGAIYCRGCGLKVN